MVKYIWFKNKVPKDLEVRQVYGIVFSNDKKILLQVCDNKYALTGGKPEKNETYSETLKREYIEEVNTLLDDIYYLGYLLVKEDNQEYAQVRMIAKINSINDNHIDPATGKMYGRELISIDKVKDYLNYDEAGNLMIDDAILMADKIYEFSYENNNI